MDLRQQVLESLKNVLDPEIKKSLVELNMIKDIEISGQDVIITVTLTTEGCPLKDKIRKDILSEVRKIEGIKNVEVIYGEMTKEQKQELAQKLHGIDERKDPFTNTRVIAVGSGKGGVGKSTVAANLAVAMSSLGYKVGLIDADILGYSIPQIMGINKERPTMIEEGIIMPIEKQGVKVISMGNLLERDEPLIWRGPVLGQVLSQFIYDFYWGELDYMFIDLPPGTGDVPLSLMQSLPKVEILIITTPQITAASVAKRLGLMAEKTKNKIIGVIENMSYFICDNCSEKHFIFGKGEGEKLSAELNTEYLGEIPLMTTLREGSDKGNVFAGDINTEIGKIYNKIAKKLGHLD
ncbi:Mrp/NBP35 family ATP-binding protein [Proteiniborus sp. MB09-C3]|uniref:Mrp/NBP35 family ATP-binding protein n=1 Tax=Proteiniborus sp. MB09-C3 TaxID=3050072 RepID=UPI0025540D40|nr:Mrp/NBP35 family ATP-binding protein [Proteiniborus sp. MB09-C3]WIV12294.1 Mrp/NBP35 family ATP-binding protein [Proteiniborus sp. MB09-C3]